MQVFTILLSLWLSSLSSVHAKSYRFPKFGNPTVCGDHILFTDPGWKSQHIIAINKVSGEKEWEISASDGEGFNIFLSPSDAFSGRCVITKGKDIYFCDPEDGELTHAFTSELKWTRVQHFHGSQAFLSGYLWDIRRLKLVDLVTGKEIWEVPEVTAVSTHTKEFIVCNRAAQKRTEDGQGFTQSNYRLTVLNADDGSVRWEHVWGNAYAIEESLIFGDYIITYNANSIYCFEAKTGKVLKKITIGKGSSVSIARDGNRVLAWHQEDWRKPGSVYAISVPELSKEKLATTDWYSANTTTYGDIVIGSTIGRTEARNIKTQEMVWQGGQWAWSGIHDGYIYFSQMNPDQNHADLIRLEVNTGKQKLLYQQKLDKPFEW